MNKYIQCSCKWIYFPISRIDAKKLTIEFNKFYQTLDAKTKSHYSGSSNIKNYEYCMRKNCQEHHKNMKEIDYIPKEAEGSTISPIIHPSN